MNISSKLEDIVNFVRAVNMIIGTELDIDIETLRTFTQYSGKYENHERHGGAV